MNFHDELDRLRIEQYKRAKTCHIMNHVIGYPRELKFWRELMIGKLINLKWTSNRRYGVYNKLLDNRKSKMFRKTFSWVWEGVK